MALLGDLDKQDTQELVKTVWSGFDPYRVVAISAYPAHENSPELVKQRPLLDGKASVYVCHHFVCQQPVNNPEELAKQLFSRSDDSQN